MYCNKNYKFDKEYNKKAILHFYRIKLFKKKKKKPIILIIMEYVLFDILFSMRSCLCFFF